MPRKKLECKKCSRRFSMPAHLARHMNTTHASRKAKARKRRSVVTRSVGAGASFTDASGLLREIQAYHADQLVKRDQIDREISALDDALAALGSTGNGAATRVVQTRKVKRASGGREGSLKNFIVKVLGQRSTPATPKEIASKVVLAGYQSKAKNLTKAVSNALPELKKVKKVGFGKYLLR